ncbi:DUF2264 domain-containing protein [Myceligenerans xiligouense]|uniref:DUF2264 domain-containing protein n=1 Tax=Myceligenerans xiligouense TaxID=253184 RepID=A0A3N4YTL2_9MICO|nr:DUF2264 domain-containing protein [Myceligenerans xiligouense]RPF22714.1 hypothetical protein EDD34_3386 [Myceligenerans xiligouense]
MSGARPASGTRYGRDGMTREELAAFADGLLTAALEYASPSGSLITLPGEPGGYGTEVDGLEGYARTFLAAGFRLAGEAGADPLNLAERYAAGLAAGTDPEHPERWVTPVEDPQAKVEAASIALILDLTRPWIWDRLAPVAQEQVVDYLSTVVGDDTYPHCNWVWFRIVVETFLRSVGGPWSADDIEADLAAHDSFLRADGWFSDGDERSYDHYAGWALHLYPVLWARMSGAVEAGAPVPATGSGPERASRRERDVAHLDRYLRDAVGLVGADGSPLLQGRSLTYRFAAAAPFWAGAVAGVPGTSPGLLRQAATRVVGHFADHGVPGPDGLLTLGWHDAWRPIAQRYSGTGSPYWAAKGLLGLALPADHPVWTAPAEPLLPVEREDAVTVLAAPGWAVSSTAGDGVVRVVNHGTDHAVEGDRAGDSPLYARLGYSTATSPLLDAEAWTRPADQSVVLLDDAGRATHRTGFRTLRAEPADGASAVLASVAEAHWLDVDPDAPDHGSGRPGTATPAGAITTVSVVHGAWEVRLVRVDALARGEDGAARARSLEISGWAVSGHDVELGELGEATAGGMRTRVVPLDDALLADVRELPDATPLGPRSAVPFGYVAPGAAVPAGTWLAAAVELAGAPGPDVTRSGSVPRIESHDDAGDDVVVHWPDGARTAVVLPPPHEPRSDAT